MPSQASNLFAPLASPLPPPPSGEVLTESQWKTLMAIGDTFIPSIETSSDPSITKLSVSKHVYTAAVNKLEEVVASNPEGSEGGIIQKYLEENASSIPGFKEALHRLFGEYLQDDARRGIRAILSALDTRIGCFLITGYTTSFHRQPVNVRQQIIQSWFQSYIPPLRKIAKGFSSLFAATWTRQSLALGRVIGFPQAPIHGKPGKGFDFSFVQFPSGDGAIIVETDVVIVGSGCGGSVCAKNLAEAGHSVVVVEKAYHFPAEHLPMSQADAAIHLYMNGGAIQADDASTAVIAGQAFGGGGTVNWSASLQTQDFVREEWAASGLPFFTSTEFQESLDRVCNRMGVSADHIEHSTNNQLLTEGAEKLGYRVKAVPQNTAGKKHYCGYCTLGCGASEKQGPTNSFLPDAAKAGANFIEGLDVEKILFEPDEKGRKTATGIKGWWKSRDSSGGVGGLDRITREVVVKGKRVIVSCGSMQSPLLLIRSGLTNSQIGRNLHLHPVALVGATYLAPSKPWEGPILTTVVTEFEDLDGHGHGVKLEALTMLPSWLLSFLPWTSGLDYKMVCAKFPYMSAHIALTRDRDTGRVYPDPASGKCRVSYHPSAFDKGSLVSGLLAAARIAYANNADTIFTAKAGQAFVRRSSLPESPSETDSRFEAWLLAIRKDGLAAGFGSAHQMGTCRMSAEEKDGVVDSTGKVWGVKGLYVADASVFPSASGVNPMVTNMAISDWISRGIAKKIKSGE